MAGDGWIAAWMHISSGRFVWELLEFGTVSKYER